MRGRVGLRRGPSRYVGAQHAGLRHGRVLCRGACGRAATRVATPRGACCSGARRAQATARWVSQRRDAGYSVAREQSRELRGERARRLVRLREERALHRGSWEMGETFYKGLGARHHTHRIRSDLHMAGDLSRPFV